MLLGLFLTTRRPEWSPSRFSELPSRDVLDNESLRDFALLAGGLSLLLSRCSDRMLLGEFRDALRVRQRIGKALRLGTKVDVSAEMLSDVAHRIAPYVDSATREAARRCMRRLAAAAAHTA